MIQKILATKANLEWRQKLYESNPDFKRYDSTTWFGDRNADSMCGSLKGLTFSSVAQIGESAIVCQVSGIYEYVDFDYDPDCCATCVIEDIAGSLEDLVGSPITMCEVSRSHERPQGVARSEYGGESETWSFLKLATVKGYVTIRWYGESNGYYSETPRMKIHADPAADAHFTF